MTGRRRHARYLLTEPLEGSLRVREEVAIEHWNDREVVVLSSVPSLPGAERLFRTAPTVSDSGRSVDRRSGDPVYASSSRRFVG
jgi:hypothetical protein